MCVVSSVSLFSQRPHKATQEEMTKFHSDDYIKFLRSIRPDNMSEYNKQMQRCKLMNDPECWHSEFLIFTFPLIYKCPQANLALQTQTELILQMILNVFENKLAMHYRCVRLPYFRASCMKIW